MTEPLGCLLQPRSVAVFGASERLPDFVGTMQRMGFKGEIYPINPKYKQVHGVKSYSRIEDVPAWGWPLVVLPHPNSLLHTGEYDTDLLFTFGRRQWALVLGPPQDHDGLFSFYAKQGYVTLDDYEDWVLDWPADPKVTYPRLVFSKEDVSRIKPMLPQHPAAEVLGKFLYFQDQPDPARREELIQRLFADPATVPENKRPMSSPALLTRTWSSP